MASGTGAARASVLVERDDLIDELAARCAAAGTGEGALVWLGGEAGVGKTSVVRAVAERVDGRTLWGACDALSTPRPLGPLRDLAAGGAAAVATALAAEQPRHVVFDALLDDLSVPTLAVVEDAHWVDEATADLLRFVGRRIARTHSLIVVTYRSDEVDRHPALRLVLGDLATAPGCRRLAVEVLSRDGIRALAAGHPLDPVQLHRVTGGNPFYATEVLASSSWSVPATVADAVLARASRLTAAERAALSIVAVEPLGMEPWLAARLGASGEAVQAATTAGMLVADGGLIRFRHELARLAIEADLGAARRAELHAAAMGALETKGADAARLAHHAELAGDRAAVVRWASIAAGQAAAAGAPRQAVAQLERVLRHFDGAAVDEVALLDRLADQLWLIDHFDALLAARRREYELRQSIGDAAATVAARAQLARAMLNTGHVEQAYATMTLATDEIERLPVCPAHGVVFAIRASFEMLARHHAGIAWADRAIAVAVAEGDDRVLARALSARGSTRICVHDDVGGIDDLEQARRIAADRGWEDVASGALTNLGSGLGEVRRHELAGPYLEAAIAHATARDFDSNRRYAGAWLARVRFEQGRWDEAEALITPELLRDDILEIATIAASGVLGRLWTRRGDPDAADPLERAWALAREAEMQRTWPVVAGRVELAWLTGDVPDSLVGELLAVLAEAERTGVRYGVGELGFWAWKLGLRATALPEQAAPPYAAHVAGDTARAVRLWDELDAPYEAAWALADAGEEDSMREALARFTALGAGPMAQRVRRQLLQRGARDVPRGPRPATAAAPGGLTPREVEVAALLVEGLGDREIGERLFVSTKTAGHHVSAILRKLGVHTRGEAARVARAWKDGPTT